MQRVWPQLHINLYRHDKQHIQFAMEPPPPARKMLESPSAALWQNERKQEVGARYTLSHIHTYPIMRFRTQQVIRSSSRPPPANILYRSAAVPHNAIRPPSFQCRVFHDSTRNPPPPTAKHVKSSNVQITASPVYFISKKGIPTAEGPTKYRC